jgi:hypothetical protein
VPGSGAACHALTAAIPPLPCQHAANHSIQEPGGRIREMPRFITLICHRGHSLIVLYADMNAFLDARRKDPLAAEALASVPRAAGLAAPRRSPAPHATAGYHEEAMLMTGMLIRDVPDDIIAALDARASRLGLPRSRYVLRRLART